MADVDPLSRPVSGQNLSVLIPALLGDVTRAAGFPVVEFVEDETVDSWGESPATATSIGFIFRGDMTTGAGTLTLPPSASDAGRMIAVIKSDSSVNALSVDPDDGGEDISGGASISLASQWDVALLIGRTDGWDRIV